MLFVDTYDPPGPPPAGQLWPRFVFWTSETRGPEASAYSVPDPAVFVPASPARLNVELVPAP